MLASIDLDRPVRDTVVLDTVQGGIDHLVQELRELPEGDAQVVRRGLDYIVVNYSGPLRPLAHARLFSRCSVAITEGWSGTVIPNTLERLDESLKGGVMSALQIVEPPLKFRVGPIGDDRWPLRDALLDHYGWDNNPGEWDINIGVQGDILRAEVGSMFLTSRFGELERLPASTTPVIAGIMCRLAKLREGDVLLDPMCGAGTLLVVAAESVNLRRVIGCDINPRAVRDARLNLARRGLTGTVLRADAGQLPVATASVDRVLANLPFGKRVGSHGDNVALYPRVLRELSRVLTSQGRVVLLTEDKNLFRQTTQRTPKLHIVRELVLESGGAHPSAFVLARTRGRR